MIVNLLVFLSFVFQKTSGYVITSCSASLEVNKKDPKIIFFCNSSEKFTSCEIQTMKKIDDGSYGYKFKFWPNVGSNGVDTYEKDGLGGRYNVDRTIEKIGRGWICNVNITSNRLQR